MSLKSLVLSKKNKKVVAKKIKKACQTRWLSFEAATRSIHHDFMAVLQTLRQLKDNDAVAAGLLSKIASSKFNGTIYRVYILRKVLPVLSSSSKNFQPSVNFTVQKLTEIAVSSLGHKKRDLDGLLSG